MTRFRFLGLGTAVLAFFAVMFPNITWAAGTFLGPIVPQIGSACHCDNQAIQGGSGTANSAPDWGCILQVLQSVINFAVYLGVILCVVWFAYAGFRLMTSGGSAEARSEGKTRIANAVIGIIVILCSWILIDFVMKTVYNPGTEFQSNVFGPWNNILASNGADLCIQPKNPTAITSGTLGILLGTTTDSSASTASGVGSAGGTCLVRDTGPCAQSNFTAAFGSAAGQASEICAAESANGNALEGDKTTSGDPVSFGLFQINITAHDVAGLPCSTKVFDSVFTGSHHNVVIKDQALYSQCRAAALHMDNNSAVAASIYKHDGNSWREWSTHTKCGLSFVDREIFAFTGYSLIR